MRKLAPLLCLLAVAGAAHGQQQEFVARADRSQVAVGEPFAFEVTLSLADARASGYRAPDFKGFRVTGETPSQSTQVQMGGGSTYVRTVYSWQYQLIPLDKGTFSIGPARVKVGGRELRTPVVTIAVVEAGQGQAPAPRARGVPGLRFPFEPDPDPDPEAAAAASTTERGTFIRAVPSKKKVYVGEQLTVEWLIYLTERPDRFTTLAEPRTDGFWAEDIPVASGQQRQEFQDGQNYLVAPALKKALFPLQPGRLTITPYEAEMAQVNFFGSTVQTQRLKSDPLTIEVQPLPTSGRPAGFDPAAIGRFAVTAAVDRERVAVGEAVTLTVRVEGQGNIRKLPPPKLEALDGWKIYEPKISVELRPGDLVAGKKTVEYLLLPERAGTTMIPAFVVPYFDPEARSYGAAKSAPIRLEVTGEAGATAASGRSLGGATVGTGGENVLGIDIRPVRRRATLRRDYTSTFYRSRAFAAAVVVPPVAFTLTVLVGWLRETLGRETERGRRRKLRRLVRRRLRLAESHLTKGQIAPFFIEIDRVLRELLSAKLGQSVTGLPRDELTRILRAAGIAPDLVDRTLAVLEECDRARFAPGSVADAELRALLERADEVVLQIEKASVKGGAKP